MKDFLHTFSERDQKRYVYYFTLLFYTLALYKFVNEMWLFQNPPFSFRLSFDVSLWFFLQTGIHQFLLDNPSSVFIFDAVFYLLPALFYVAFLKKANFSIWIAAFMLIFNCVYVWLYSVYPITSAETQIAWLFTPLLLMNRSVINFHLWMHILRYVFIFFFFSAGLWKIAQGGLWEPEEMSGILLQQHKELLATGVNNPYSSFIYFMIENRVAGRLLYVGATVIELSFIIGFFTKNFDRLLFVFFIVFVLMDLLIMRICYFEAVALALPLLFSAKDDPES